jgi:hypothetical protein
MDDPSLHFNKVLGTERYCVNVSRPNPYSIKAGKADVCKQIGLYPYVDVAEASV